MANASSFSGQLTFLQKGRTKDKSQDKEIATCERQVAPIGLILWSMQSGSMRAEKRMPQKGGGKGSKGHEKRMKSGWDCGKCCCCCNRILLCVDSMGLRPAVAYFPWTGVVRGPKGPCPLPPASCIAVLIKSIRPLRTANRMSRRTPQPFCRCVCVCVCL